MIELLLIFVSLLLILLSGIFVAAEFSFITVDRRKVEKLAASGDARASGLLHGLKTLSTQLSGAQIGITVTSLIVGFLAQPAIASLIVSPLEAFGTPSSVAPGIALIIAIALATIATMVFGELVPKNIAIATPLKTALFVQAVQRGFSWIMHYPIVIMNGTANLILRKFNLEPQEELASARSAEELLTVVRHSAKKGVLPQETALMLQRSLEFSERNAADVATPRVKIEAIAITEKVTKIIERAKETGHSRFPIYKDSVDNIVGIAHIKNVFRVPFAERSSTPVTKVMQDALLVPESIDLDALMEKIRINNMQMAVTIDEFGGTAGIVTAEDLVEELVGEVYDEHDQEGAAIRQLSKRSWIISGLLRPDEVTEVTHITIPEDEDYETMGGLLLGKFEEVPDVGDVTYLNSFDTIGKPWRIKLTVRSMDNHRIDRFIMEISPRQSTDSTGNDTDNEADS